MRRRITALDGTAALSILLLMVQVWLLSATLDAYSGWPHRCCFTRGASAADLSLHPQRACIGSCIALIVSARPGAIW